MVGNGLSTGDDNSHRGDNDVICLSYSPNFYILDEPTNHLDMETIEALAEALNKFKVRLDLLYHSSLDLCLWLSLRSM